MQDFQIAVLAPYARFDTTGRIQQADVLFAHYTTLQTVEAILSKGELWFSNPLCMNDTEEMRWGVDAATEIIEGLPELQAAFGGDERYQKFRSSFSFYLRDFSEKLALDVYVFCLTEHDAHDWAGSLTMWRAYGASGNGAAIVFNAAGVMDDADEPSNLYFAPVTYDTAEGRQAILKSLVDDFVDVLRQAPPPDDQIHEFAYHLLQCVLTQSLLLKHDGFRDEREWRLIYMGHVDGDDELAEDRSYHIGPQGPEPKLKFRVRPIKGMKNATLTLSNLVDRIIVGPGQATPLSVATFKRIVAKSLSPAHAERVVGSTIPFRPR